MTVRQEILGEIEEAFGFVPGWLSDMPDVVLEQYWTNHVWVCSDTALSGREKALIAFGAAAAIHCGYRTPFHTAQLALFGLDEEQIKEAGWVVQNVTGASAYLYASGTTRKRLRRNSMRWWSTEKSCISVTFGSVSQQLRQTVKGAIGLPVKRLLYVA